MEEYVHYQEFGKGPTVVILPSFGLTSYSYAPLFKPLAKQYRVIIPDLYRGSSQFKKNARTIDDYVTKLHTFLQQRNIHTYFIIGFSFSTLIVSTYATRYAEEVRKLLLISPIIPSVLPKTKKLTLRSALTGYTKLFYHNALSRKGMGVNLLWLSDAFTHYLFIHPKQFVLDAFMAIRNAEYQNEEFPVPTVFFVARKDEFIPYMPLEITTRNLTIETFDGYHGWFFINENTCIKEILRSLCEKK